MEVPGVRGAQGGGPCKRRRLSIVRAALASRDRRERAKSCRSPPSLATIRRYTALVRSYGLRQEFITPHCPHQNGMVEREIRSLKAQCVHRHRFETLQHANRAIGDWIGLYNHRRPHQALGMKTPAMAFDLAA